MDAGDLDRGFRLGDWVVEPRLGRISGNGQSHSLAPHQVRLLQILAARHGEVVDRQVLRDHAWPGADTTDEMLRAAIRGLREALGDSPADPRYIAKVSKRGYALIAHFEPVAQPERAQQAIEPRAVVIRGAPVARLQRLVSEFRRRHVFKVLGAYLVGMWIMLQVAQTTFAPLHFPDWWMTALTILAVIGIPIVGVLAWSYEITPAGIVRDAADSRHASLPRARRAMAPVLVLGVALMAGVTGAAWWRSIGEAGRTTARAAEPAARSIAVLPLVDMTAQGGNAYLGDGFSEEISAQLSQIPGLRVASRTSAFEFKGKSVDVRRIGEALGVHNVLEGSVRRDGNKLRVTVQLINAANGYHLWAGSYDRDWADVISIQDQIARSIANALDIVLTPEAERRLRRGSVGNLAAYDSYLAGVSAMHQSGDLSQLNRAADLFRKALDLDPEFSRAYAGLCEVGVRRYDRTRAPAEVAAAEAACRKALELDPARDETEMALGKLYLNGGRYEQAEAMYRGLVLRRPSDADAYVGLGRALDGEGQKPAAEQAYRKAVEIEPAYWAAHSALGGFFFESGRADAAIAEFRRTTELVPQSASAYTNLGAALMMAVRLKEAAAAFERAIAIEPSRAAHANLGTLYYFLGRFPDAAEQYKSAEVLASQDQAIVGSYADAVWQVGGRRAEAVAEYGRAITLAEGSLKVNPSDALTWAQLAYYANRVGDRQRAVRAGAKAEALGADDMYVHYYLALIAADRGDGVAARDAIQRARQLGYPMKLLEADPVLRSFLPREAPHADRPHRP